MTPKFSRVRIKLDKLKPHPLQHQYFRPCSEAEDEALREDIRAHGVREPPQVVPANDAREYMIVTGHRRIAAARELGMAEIEVTIRHDLATAPPETIEALLISDNANRRQVGPVGLGRIGKRLMELQRGRGLNPNDERELRDRVGATLGISGRQAWRYIRIANAPLVVQQLVEAAHLKQTLAERVENLDEAQKKALVRRLGKLNDPKDANGIVAEFLPAPRRKQRFLDPLQRLQDSVAHFVDDVNAAAASLESAHQTLAKHDPDDDWSDVKKDLIRNRLSAHRPTLLAADEIIGRVLAALDDQ